MNVPLTRYWSLLSTYLRPQWRRVALLLCNIALQLLNPQILLGSIDTARSGGALRSLTVAALLFLGVALVIQLLSVAETYVAENVGWTATNSLRADLTLHCLHLDPDFHAAQTPGAMIERIDGDVAVLGNFFSRFVVYVLGNALLLAGVLALLYGINVRIGVALTLFAAVTLLVMNRMRDVATPHWAAARQASAALFGFLEEHIASAALSSALRLAVLERDVETLEHGLETLVGPRGVKLSGGQIQRAAARMFVREPELFVFDDLSSALDELLATWEEMQHLWAGEWGGSDISQ